MVIRHEQVSQLMLYETELQMSAGPGLAKHLLQKPLSLLLFPYRFN